MLLSDDEPTTRAARLGDPRAQRRLYGAHLPAARARLERAGVDPAEQEELAHRALTAALLRLARAAPEAEPPARFAALVEAACARLAARHRLARARAPERCVLDEGLVDPRPDPHARAAARQTLARVAALFARLSPDKRGTLELHVLEGQAIHTIARRAFVTPSAIGRRIARARAELAEMARRRDLGVGASSSRPSRPEVRTRPRDICPIRVAAGPHGRRAPTARIAPRRRVDSAPERWRQARA